MKVKITSGDSTFSFEGELEEAQALLDAYWDPQPKPASSAQQPSEDVAKRQSNPTRKKRTKSAPKGAASAAAVSIDAQDLANKIKTSSNFPAVKQKILDVKADWMSKCKMVAHFADEPITSGDVKRVMDEFKIKAALSTLSKKLSGNSDKFLTKGDNPVKYELTSIAEDEFLTWLSSDTNE